MNVDLRLNLVALKSGINLTLRELVAHASEDLRAKIQFEVERISQRTAELGILALQGDRLASKMLDEIRDKAIKECEIITIRERDRLASIAELIASMSIKILVSSKLHEDG